jgi:hypothetical protein
MQDKKCPVSWATVSLLDGGNFMATPPIILVEFNELCPSLLDRWIESGELPNFKRLHDSSTVCVTEADELNNPYLEPWIQWYSVHTGLPFREHGVFRLSEGAGRPYASVWDLLLGRGLRVMNFSSMNCRGFRGQDSVFLPDPWNDGEQAFPSDLEVFRKFVSRSIQEQSRMDWSAKELLAVVRFLLRHGLRPATALTAAAQLIGERMSGASTEWRRVRVLDHILLDVFLHYYRRNKPEFATFFSNSTAHLQHSYWRFHEPRKFSQPVSERDRAAYSGAVKFGYQSMDGMLGRILDAAAPSGAIVMFATALSQQAYLAYEGRGGRHYYRPLDVRALLAAIEVEPIDLQPVMTHQFILTFANREERLAAEQSLKTVTVEAKPVFDVADGESPSKLIFGAQIYSPLAPNAIVHYQCGNDLMQEPFFSRFYELEATKSGGHHPEGCFWIQTGRHRRLPNKVSILDIAPTILRHFNLDAASMRGQPLNAAASIGCDSVSVARP